MPQEARDFYVRQRLPKGETALSPELYLKAKEQKDRMARYSIARGRDLTAAELVTPVVGDWEPLGPGNIGGRTRQLVIDPGTPNTMYAAAVDGGVWKTNNAGSTWVALDDMMASIAVSSLAMDPGNSSVLYAGTGEGFYNIDAVRGAGIFMTSNAGTTWTRIASTANSNFYYVNDIVVSPNSSMRIYAATRQGVFRTTNGGSSWTQVYDASSILGCTDLVIKSSGPEDIVFAACGTFLGGEIRRNTDAGGSGTWDQVYTETDMGRTHLALAPSNEDTVYALISSIGAGDYEYGLLAVIRSTTGGGSGTWSDRVRNDDATIGNTLLLTNAPYQVCVGPSHPFLNQGWYDNVIAVDPTDPDVVWVGGIDTFRSDDGGQSWSIASLWYADIIESMYAHADNHAIVFHPDYDGSSNKTMFVTSDGGIFRTNNPDGAVDDIIDSKICDTNDSTIGVTWQNLNNGYAVTQFYEGSVYPDGTTYFGGTQDNGTVRGTDGGGKNAWSEIWGGDGGWTAVDSSNTDVLFVENTGFSIRKSVNGGTDFADAIAGIADPGGQFINPFEMDRGNSNRLWTGGWYFWRTTDQVTTPWVRASAITSGNESVSAIGISPSNGDHVIGAMSDGYIHYTTGALSAGSATVWPESRPNGDAWVSSIAFDPQDDMVAYATFSTFGVTHVWKSEDAGASWSGLDGSGDGALPDLPVHTIVVDPTDSKKLYIGTDLGVFVSVDGGLFWKVANSSFANVVVEALELGAAGGQDYLYAFTHGRSAWRTPVEPGSIFSDGFESGDTSAWTVP